MEVQVTFKAQLKKAAGVSRDSIVLEDGASLKGLLLCLANKYGDAFGRLVIDEENQRKSSTLVFIKGSQVAIEDNPTLSNNDSLTLMTPIAGG